MCKHRGGFPEGQSPIVLDTLSNAEYNSKYLKKTGIWNKQLESEPRDPPPPPRQFTSYVHRQAHTAAEPSRQSDHSAARPTTFSVYGNSRHSPRRTQRHPPSAHCALRRSRPAYNSCVANTRIPVTSGGDSLTHYAVSLRARH